MQPIPIIQAPDPHRSRQLHEAFWRAVRQHALQSQRPGLGAKSQQPSSATERRAMPASSIRNKAA